MDKCPEKFHMDQTEKGFFVCSVCECKFGVHCAFIHCPLLENEVICTDCCTNEVPSNSIIEKFKEIGLEYTREQIDKVCKECGCRPVGQVAEESNDNDGNGISESR